MPAKSGKVPEATDIASDKWYSEAVARTTGNGSSPFGLWNFTLCASFVVCLALGMAQLWRKRDKEVL